MALHMAGNPVTLFSSVHCAAATENFLVLEHHDVDTPYYEDLIDGVPKPLVSKEGVVQVPDGPGLGITLNEAAVKESLRRADRDPTKFFFPPTDDWNRERSHDRTWSYEPAGKRRVPPYFRSPRIGCPRSAICSRI